ncbi:MAG: GtrA family protein [Bacteroidales bacterium]|jgi:putative flippase GtrA|nr:GtrA family protein [Bacteroidales bacterium]
MLAEYITSELIGKFLKFCVVGVSGTIIDFGLTALCKEIFKIQKYVSNAIGFTIAATSNYFLNRIWAFKSENSQIGQEYITFMIISVIGLLINTSILFLCSKKLHLNFYLSKVIATGVTLIWNFLANLLITFA